MEQKEIAASIVMRAYNAEKTLARAIQSALAQDFPHDQYEIVVVDDGSTDSTKTIADSFLGDARLRVIGQDNQGAVAAANSGFAAAQGDIILMLDGDDEALPNFVSVASSALADTRFEYAYTGYIEEFRGVEKTVRPADPFKALAGGLVWRRQPLLAEGGFLGGTIFPEYDILLRTWGRWHGIAISEPTFLYHRREGSLSSQEVNVRMALEVLRKKYPDRTTEINLIRPYDL